MTLRKVPHLKTRNAPLFLLFVLWCVALYMVFLVHGHVRPNDIGTAIKSLRAKDGLFVALSPLLVIVLSGVISSENKARLIFWRKRHALPGHRAFSTLAKADSRIDTERLRKLVDPWPTSPAAQNKAWYAIYQQHQAATTVKESHSSFLLTRDMATTALVFAVFGAWPILFLTHDGLRSSSYGGVMLVQYLVLMIVCRNHGNRFVCNVLAEHAARKRTP